MIQCKHLELSAPTEGDPDLVRVHLCGWADNNPEAMKDAPRWLLGEALNASIIPKQHCMGCKAFEAR